MPTLKYISDDKTLSDNQLFTIRFRDTMEVLSVIQDQIDVINAAFTSEYEYQNSGMMIFKTCHEKMKAMLDQRYALLSAKKLLEYADRLDDPFEDYLKAEPLNEIKSENI